MKLKAVEPILLTQLSQIFMRILPYPSTLSWFHHPNNRWRRTQIIKPPIEKSFYFPFTSSRWLVNIPKSVLTLTFRSRFLMYNVGFRGLVASYVEDVPLSWEWIHGWGSRQPHPYAPQQSCLLPSPHRFIPNTGLQCMSQSKSWSIFNI
jgi:hypothetical protein